MDILQKLIRGRSGGPAPCAAVIVAAGSATRMNGIDKMMADLRGEPVLLRTLRTFHECSRIDEIVVVTREDLLPAVEELCRRHGLDKVHHLVVGGDERSSSVLAGLDCIADREGLVAIHDGARPLVTEDLIVRAIEKAEETGAAAPAVPMKDTVKVARRGIIEATPDRSSLVAVQTPQVFDLDLVRGALYKAEQEGIVVTDDCSAVERLGMKVHLTAGSDENMKITTPVDLIVAASILDGREQPCGSATDTTSTV